MLSPTAVRRRERALTAFSLELPEYAYTILLVLSARAGVSKRTVIMDALELLSARANDPNAPSSRYKA